MFSAKPETLRAILEVFTDDYTHNAFGVAKNEIQIKSRSEMRELPL